MTSAKTCYTMDAMFSYTCSDDDDPVAFLDAVVTSLEGLHAEDVIVALDPVEQKFSVSLLLATGEDGKVEDVVAEGMGLLRTSFHACNGGTANWPTLKEAFVAVHLEPAEVEAEVGERVPVGV